MRTKAFRVMPIRARGTPRRPASPPGQMIDRSLGPDPVKFMAPAVMPPTPVGILGGLAPDHDVGHGWNNPKPKAVEETRLTGLDNALSKVTNPNAIAAIKRAQARKAGI